MVKQAISNEFLLKKVIPRVTKTLDTEVIHSMAGTGTQSYKNLNPLAKKTLDQLTNIRNLTGNTDISNLKFALENDIKSFYNPSFQKNKEEFFTQGVLQDLGYKHNISSLLSSKPKSINTASLPDPVIIEPKAFDVPVTPKPAETAKNEPQQSFLQKHKKLIAGLGLGSLVAAGYGVYNYNDK